MRLCRADEIGVGAVRRVELEDGPALAVVRCDDGYHAVVDNCSHEDYPLSEGEVYPDVCEIECVRHGSTFSLEDGSPQCLPATRPIIVLGVEVADGDVFVNLP